ncbi:hypothetical protein [Salipiger sp. PrR007]|uniref:hypothetical protein n=1 Tax=Salipiger sp. PrR007 TaxID=2706884 RepID=UPI0013B827D5|nr:hypothetical protein [Salipiger sp. PrR007]NDW32021.1 hypothetical protein [Salipiger sp. PrR007]
MNTGWQEIRRRARLPVLLLVLLLELRPDPTAAQQVVLRSGEHDGFTRLVLDLPEGLGWQGVPGPDGASYLVELARGGFEIRLDDVFRRIGRDRVAAVAALPGGTGVELALACDCVVESSLHDGHLAVLDVRPRRANEPRPEPPPATAQANGAARVEDRTVVETPGAPPGLDLGLLPGLSDAAGARRLLPTFDPGPRLVDEVLTPASDREIAQSFGQSLAEELARGATQGLLDADGPLQEPMKQAGTPEDGSGAEADRAARAPDPISAEILAGSAARGFGATSVLRLGGQRACVEDRRLDLPGWFGEEGEAAAVARLGALRSRLLGEFDRIDTQVQRDLARLYISLGFGAEARALLRLENDIPDPVLMTLATLTEGGADPAGVFAGQSECPGRAALWAVLGARGLPDTAQIAVPAIMATFEELPLGLRRILGPRLSERLAEEGEFDAARNVLSRLARALGRVTEEMQLAAARIARATGATAEAETLLSELIAAPGELGVAAAVESIDLATAEGHQVPSEMVELTGAYSTERRTTDSRDALWLAHVRAAWANAEFDRAFAEISGPAEVAAETRLRARAEALEALTASGPDAKFLRHALDPLNLALAPVDPGLALKVADRLLALGLPEAAGRWLAGPAPPGRAHDWRLLEARLALASQRPEAAEIALVGLQGDDVLRLRAEAREGMGDFEFAQAAYEQLGDAQNAARLAWLAGDLEATARGEDPVLAEAAALARAAPPEAGMPTLEQGQALAESGKSTIETIRALLAESAVPAL